jgi:hypothetical protein
MPVSPIPWKIITRRPAGRPRGAVTSPHRTLSIFTYMQNCTDVLAHDELTRPHFQCQRLQACVTCWANLKLICCSLRQNMSAADQTHAQIWCIVRQIFPPRSVPLASADPEYSTRQKHGDSCSMNSGPSCYSRP